ncbi:hypothetical protein FRC09_008463 [Ceratobasidium sp. 395]|nr:hypothetical protein FRC09_008463 [Ceratobasidium sp. 395]
MDTIKEAYPATNKKDWEVQTLQWFARHNKLIELLLFHTWRKDRKASANSVIAAEDAVAGDQSVGNMTTDSDGTSRAENSDGGLTTTGPEPDVQRHKRGGFAPVVSNPQPNLVPTAQTKPATAAMKKRKRQIGDVDDSEERSAKQIAGVQQTYDLSRFHDIAVAPETKTMAEVQSKYMLPTLLDDCKEAHLVPASASLQTLVEAKWVRVHATPPSDKDPAVADPVLYVEGRGIGQSVDRSQLRLQDCKIGQLQLIFCIPPSTSQTQPPPIFVYIHNFLSLPPAPEKATNMYVITKPACIRPKLVELSNIIHLCPLTPRISGPGIPGVTPQTSLDRYDSFYVNKFRSTRDFIFFNNIKLVRSTGFPLIDC